MANQHRLTLPRSPSIIDQSSLVLETSIIIIIIIADLVVVWLRRQVSDPKVPGSNPGWGMDVCGFKKKRFNSYKTEEGPKSLVTNMAQKYTIYNLR